MEYSKSMFEYWTEDDFASSFRKMLTIEQFRSEEMQNLYQQYLVSGPAGYVKDLFKNMEIKNPERLGKNQNKDDDKRNNIIKNYCFHLCILLFLINSDLQNTCY